MRTPVTIRASSFGSLFDCPARWIEIHMKGRKVPSTSKAALGTAVHAGTAAFDTERVEGREPSLDAAKDAAAEKVRAPGYEIDWQEDRPADAIDIAVSLTERYATLESPRHEFVAVEASVDALHVTDLDLVLTGTTDRVYRAPDTGELGIADVKTGKTIVRADGTVDAKGHAAQLGIYELVGGAAIAQPLTAPAKVIGLQTNKTAEKQRIATADVVGAREPLLGDEHHSGLLHTAARLVHGEIDAWGNPRSMMCHERYCPAYRTCFWRR
jgi:RecB family exonuclease